MRSLRDGTIFKTMFFYIFKTISFVLNYTMETLCFKYKLQKNCIKIMYKYNFCDP